MRICMDKWCQNELKWRLESHEQYWWTNEAKMNSNELKWRHESHDQYGWTNDAKMHKNEDLNPMSNMDGQMMPKYTQMKTRISWAIWMDKCCQNELKWRLESHELYGWTIGAKMNTNEDLNPMSNIDGQMMSKWTQMNSTANLKLVCNMDGQMMPKWTQMKTWVPWAIWMEKWCQNELKWRLESHEKYGWTNDAKMNSNEGLNTMSNMDGQMMPKWTQIEESNPMRNMDGQMVPKWTQMKTWIPWVLLMDKWCQNELKWTQMKTWISWAIWVDKWCQNELKWRLEYHEQYGWTNDAKINSNEDSNPMSNMDGQMMPNELKWRLESHEQYGWTNDAKMNSNEDSNPISNMDGQMMPNELKWRLESHENMDGQMMPKWTQMKSRIPWAIWMNKWCHNEHKWRL